MQKSTALLLSWQTSRSPLPSGTRWRASQRRWWRTSTVSRLSTQLTIVHSVLPFICWSWLSSMHSSNRSFRNSVIWCRKLKINGKKKAAFNFHYFRIFFCLFKFTFLPDVSRSASSSLFFPDCSDICPAITKPLKPVLEGPDSRAKEDAPEGRLLKRAFRLCLAFKC